MKLKILWTFFALWGLSYISLFAQPTATIVSSDADSCEIGKAELKILFQGEAPFGVVYRIDNKETGGSSYQMELNKDIFDNDLVDGVWTTTTINISDTSEITLIEVFDNSIDAANWKFSLSDNGYGSTDVSGKMTLNINEMPTPNAGINADTCGYSYKLKGIPDEISTKYYWTSENGTFDEATNADAKFTAATSGTYTVTFNQENGACTATDDVDIWIKGYASSTLSGEQIICSTDGTNYQITTNTNINGVPPFTYKLSDGIDGNYTKTVNNVGDNQLLIPATKNATFKVIEIKDGNNCTVDTLLSDMLIGTANVIDKKPIAVAGKDSIECSDQIRLYADALQENETGRWIFDQSKINIDDATTNDAMATAIEYGQHTFQWEVNNAGCLNTDEVAVTFVEPPTLNLLSPDTAICAGSNALLRTASTSEYYDLVLTYTDGAQTLAANINSINTETILEPSETTAYQLTTITDNKGCSTELSETFNVVVDYIPELMTGTYDTICGNWTPLNAEILENTTSGYWSSENGTFSDPSSPSASFTFDQITVIDSASVQWLVVNEENLNCRDSATFKLYFTKEPENVSAGSDSTIYLVDHVTLQPSGYEDGMTGWWESSDPNVMIQSSTDGSGTASVIPPGTSYLTWTVKSSDDCYISDEITITQNPLTAPNGFSPDGDGINDFFKIGGAENLRNKKLAVFNKKGMLIYDTENLGYYNTGSDLVIWWDGKDNDGNILPADTYYYTFTGDYNGQVFTKKDFVVIKY
nr:gliding motility-associated C-terminal domain-containing protein [uncultured Carboxylicivirga sp.]